MAEGKEEEEPVQGSPGSSKRHESDAGKEERAARRRRILERGSQRLAYITGEVAALPAGGQTSPALTPSKEPSPSNFSPGFQTFSPGSSSPPFLTPPSSSRSARHVAQNAETLGVDLGIQGEVREGGQGEGISSRVNTTPLSSSFQQSVSPTHSFENSPPLANLLGEFRSAKRLFANELQTQSSRSVQALRSEAPPRKSMETPLQDRQGEGRRKVILGSIAEAFEVPAINKAVDATEGIRIFLSVLVALISLAQLLSATCDLPGSHIFRLLVNPFPLLSVLLTSFAVVMGMLFVKYQFKKPITPSPPYSSSIPLQAGGLKERIGSDFSSEDDDPVKALEGLLEKLQGTMGRGMLMLKVSRSLMVDVCFYVVAVGCGKSLMDWLAPHCVSQ